MIGDEGLLTMKFEICQQAGFRVRFNAPWNKKLHWCSQVSSGRKWGL